MASESELKRIRARDNEESTDNLVWAIIFREGPLTAGAIRERAGMRAEELEATLFRLLEAGRIRKISGSDEPEYGAREFEVKLGDPAGWEAAVFDHYQALVTTICRKLQIDPASGSGDTVGGSTYTMSVWSGHPLEKEVEAELSRYRERMSELRRRVDEYNSENGFPPEFKNVICYGGQCVIEQEEDEVNREEDGA
jgi:hypothetical protein